MDTHILAKFSVYFLFLFLTLLITPEIIIYLSSSDHSDLYGSKSVAHLQFSPCQINNFLSDGIVSWNKWLQSQHCTLNWYQLPDDLLHFSNISVSHSTASMNKVLQSLQLFLISGNWSIKPISRKESRCNCHFLGRSLIIFLLH